MKCFEEFLEGNISIKLDANGEIERTELLNYVAKLGLDTIIIPFGKTRDYDAHLVKNWKYNSDELCFFYNEFEEVIHPEKEEEALAEGKHVIAFNTFKEITNDYLIERKMNIPGFKKAYNLNSQIKVKLAFSHFIKPTVYYRKKGATNWSVYLDEAYVFTDKQELIDVLEYEFENNYTFMNIGSGKFSIINL